MRGFCFVTMTEAGFLGRNQCDRVENCATIEVWRRLNDAINGVVDNITLADLVEWQNNNKENYTI